MQGAWPKAKTSPCGEGIYPRWAAQQPPNQATRSARSIADRSHAPAWECSHGRSASQEPNAERPLRRPHAERGNDQVVG